MSENIIELTVGFLIHARSLRPLNKALTDRVLHALQHDRVTGRQEQHVHLRVMVANNLNQFVTRRRFLNGRFCLRVHGEQFVTGLEK